MWITRAPGMEPTLKTNAYERGTYYFFDCLNWRKVAKVTTPLSHPSLRMSVFERELRGFSEEVCLRERPREGEYVCLRERQKEAERGREKESMCV